jgi:hypothetical protein
MRGLLLCPTFGRHVLLIVFVRPLPDGCWPERSLFQPNTP